MLRSLSSSLAACSLVAALSLSPEHVSAQSSDSTAFRAGQWGVDFAVGSSAALGVLRFATPTRAWFGQIRGSVESRDDGVPAGAIRQNSRTIELQLGNRWYRPALQNVVQHVTVGALVAHSRVERERFSEINAGYAFGIFADVGAQWMIRRNLSLGASYGLSTTYGKSKFTSSTVEQSLTNASLLLGPAVIRAALYF